MLNFTNPWKDAAGDGYQLIQSFYALGSGGITGLGLGQSRQKILYMPEPHNDFIFAIIGEELGLIGCLFVIALFVIFYNNNNVSIKQLRFINLFIGALLTILIIVNNLMFIKWRVNDLRISINIIEEVKRISNENTSVELGLIDKSRFGILYNLNDNKLNYKLVEYKEDMKNFFYNNWIGY